MKGVVLMHKLGSDKLPGDIYVLREGMKEVLNRIRNNLIMVIFVFPKEDTIQSVL